jgi:hypothetical protein
MWGFPPQSPGDTTGLVVTGGPPATAATGMTIWLDAVIKGSAP